MPAQPRYQHATFAVLTSAALFGTTGTVLVNAPSASDQYSVGAMRLLIGGATLAAVAATRTGIRTTLRTTLRTTALGAVGVAVFQLCYFLAVTRTGVAVGTVATIGSGPMFAGLIATAMNRRRPSARWMLGTGLGVGGVTVLGLMGRDTTVNIAGIALAFMAGLGWAVFATIGKRQIEGGRDSTATMAAMFCGGALLMAPLLIWHHPNWVASGSGALVALYLGVATVGIAYTLYGFALRHLPTHTVVTLTLLEPITAATLGAVVVHEQILPIGWLGVAAVLVGLVIVSTTRSFTQSSAGGVVAPNGHADYTDPQVETAS
ncbi:DMT family transporter [soil metagenome]